MKTQKFSTSVAGRIVEQMRAIPGIAYVTVSRPFGREPKARTITWDVIGYTKRERTSARQQRMAAAQAEAYRLAHTIPGYFGTHRNSGLITEQAGAPVAA